MRFALASTLLAACNLPEAEDPMTFEEAIEAVEQSVASAKVESASSEVIEISTSFTMGQALEAAAEELRAWFESQMPCSTVTVDGPAVTVDFGTLDDACVYRGHTYAGVTVITVEATEEAELVVDHEWRAMTNGDTTLDGGAVVTWSGADRTRHVVHDATWADAERTIEGTGDRLQSLIDEGAGIEGGISVDGERAWEVTHTAVSDRTGRWTLDIQDVEMRGQDPVPQAGSYVLVNPDGKELTVLFERIDEDTIQVTLIGMREEQVIRVHSDGAVEG